MMQEQDSEPLFGPEVYSLLREDSLLTRTGSHNFATLVDSLDNNTTAQGVEALPSLSEHPPRYYHVQQEQGEQQELDLVFNPQNEEILWEHLEMDDSLQVTGGTDVSVLPPSDPMQQQHVAVIADSSGEVSVNLPQTPSSPPSLQPWPGRYSFSYSLPTDNKDRNKWCFSQLQQKLYTCPCVAVPIQFVMNPWPSGGEQYHIYITPVFKNSRHSSEPVLRCFNCKKESDNEMKKEHIVNVEGDGSNYLVIGNRPVVSVPLHLPPPGELTSTLLVKLTCLTSCVGGPNRRPFCLVFTLRDHTGREVGRQVLDVKCCKCPSRDMNHEDKNAAPPETTCNNVFGNKMDKVQKLASSLTMGQKRKKIIKVEPEAEPYVTLKVPLEFERAVKGYLNQLVAMKYYAKQGITGMLPYPEVE